MTGPAPEAARRLWRHLAGDDAALEPGSTCVVRGSRGLAPPSWTGVVRLGDATVVEAGDADEATLARLLALEDPSDQTLVATALGPACTLGPGELAYLPDHWRRPSSTTDGELRELPVTELASWLDALPPADVEESSVGEMDRAVVVVRAGRMVGAAGHLRWPTDIAHLGIVVTRDARGTGAGRCLAIAATDRAVAAGLTPQWRAASTNEASRRVARGVGFQEVGRQFSFRMTST